MARKLRLEYAGACYHVINRGNYRRDLFAGKGAAESFEGCLFEGAERFGWRVHAYVIMRNHFHLAVETPEPNLSEGMRWLQATWAARFNRFRGESGRPFQGRYKALHVEPGHSLAQVAHYIHLNPVRARVVTPERLPEFRWSSLHRFVRHARPAVLVAETVLGESGTLSDTAAGWRQYVAYLGLLAEEEARMREKRFGRLSRGWMVGSPGFRDELKKGLQEQADTLARFELLGGDREALREARTAIWEEKLQAGAKVFGVSLDRLPERYSAPEKVALACLMKQGTSVSNGWLAERLGMGQPASVSQFVRRFRQGGGMQTRDFRRAQSIIQVQLPKSNEA
ncbi:MAG: transposase [Verrucomicrobia bacterium]|nr:transposase [Verrucomicrobiota bacterium]